MSATSAPARAAADTTDTTFEPVILGFTCNWCSYRAADLAGTARIKYPPNIRLVRLMCSGRLDPTFILKAFALGADGVLISGCWPGECHYQVQNIKALRRVRLLKRVVEGLGIEPVRLQLVWASAAEGQRLAKEIARFTAEVRAAGPLNWGRPADPGEIAAAMVHAVSAGQVPGVMEASLEPVEVRG
jgi:F420-non-reducing hydrogenase iron-sulfur subunit